MSDNKNALLSMLEVINRRSIEIIELPESKREGRYNNCLADYYQAAGEEWGDWEHAKAYADKIIELVRSLVTFIEAGGGAARGRAHPAEHQ
ncbi:MAG: hypothetical protein JO339_03515 [Alphaproteobacteria bacterium]|nr:hypothetical protein [Alphaproteobacteria bacterium]